jgi:ferredoxin--NADP+ reductase
MTTRDWRVAVVGAGPAGLYAASALLKRGAKVDVFERQFAPFGLVRYGVAPDHQKIKRTQTVFQRILDEPGVRFFGNVSIGRDLKVDELLDLYDQVLVTIGSSGALSLEIPGEQLRGSLSATELVGWYNGHPENLDLNPPTDHEHVVIVGMGNVAIDVARLFVRRPEDLASTDLPDYALEAFSKSRVRRVTLLARRGPNQAAFDEKEVRDLAGLPGVQLSVQGYISRRSTKISDFIATFPRKLDPLAERQVVLQFCASPKEILGTSRVTGVRVERNQLAESAARIRAVGTGEMSILEAGLIVRAIGYQATPLPGVPFVEATGTIPNEAGRVLDGAEGHPVRGLYVAGWIKRGATGLIGTNKGCALSTVELMEADLDQMGPVRDDSAILRLLLERRIRVVSSDDWKKLDSHELRLGEESGRPRVKLVRLEDALRILDSAC